MLQTGIKGRCETIVTADQTAKHMKSGTLDVFATPAMIALVEETAWKSVSDALEPGQGTVGTHLSISHLSATPMGMRVWCETQLTEIDGRRLVFHAEVFDDAGKIGEGTHERFLVDNARFFQKTLKKLPSEIS